MKRRLLPLLVIPALFIAANGDARGKDDDHRRERGFSAETERLERELDLQERKDELQFQRRMRELRLELTRRKMASEPRGTRGGRGEFQRRDWPHAPVCPMMRRHPGRLFVFLAPFLILAFVVHILLAVWVYKDIRERNSDSGVWIVITLLTGMCGAAVYAIVRLGDVGNSGE